MKTITKQEDVFVGRVACRYIRAIIIRVTFMVHALLTLWKLYLVKKEDVYLWLGLLLLLMPIEAVVTLKVKKGGEWQWFCPSFFFFLLSVVPSIWILELHRLHQKQDCLCGRNTTTDALTTSSANLAFGIQVQSLVDHPSNHSMVPYQLADTQNENQFENGTKYPTHMEGHMINGTTEGHMINVTGQEYTSEQTTFHGETSDVTVTNVSIGVPETRPPHIVEKIGSFLELGESDTWVTALEQIMLYLLILGRWFLPRGNMTHDKLSQLLFVFIGMASDIMELFYLFDENAVVKDGLMGYIILTVWSVSLLQFTFILTATSAKKRKVTHNIGKVKVQGYCRCTHNEIWAILITVFLQDAPFLSVRLYVGIGLHVFTYSLLFFTIKNCLVILLQIYRISVVCLYDNQEEEHVAKTESEQLELGNSSGESIMVRETRDIYGTFYKRADIAEEKELKLGIAPLADDD